MVDMNQTEYNQILKIIQRDIQSNDLDHLKQIRDYLNKLPELSKDSEQGTIFNDPELESKKELLLTPMEDFFDEIKQIGPRSATYPLSFLLQKEFVWKNNNLGVNFAVERREQQPGQPLVCLAHFIQLTESEIRNQNGIGQWTFNAYQQFVEEKGLSFGTEISREENEKIAKYLMKKSEKTSKGTHRR